MAVEVKQFRAKHRFARISARKARLIADIVRGKAVNQALEILRFNPKRAAVMFDKVIRSAMANAGQDADVEVNRLYLSKVLVDGGPLAQGRLRYRIQSRQGVVPIHRRTCHIQVVLAERPAPPDASARPRSPKSQAAAAREPASEPEAPVKASGEGEGTSKKRTAKKRGSE
jgi:large subunit ribosomal protein L22